jgi:hypothetical protein
MFGQGSGFEGALTDRWAAKGDGCCQDREQSQVALSVGVQLRCYEPRNSGASP